MNYDYSAEAEAFEKATLLNEDDIRELSWVADVLESGYTNRLLTCTELHDLAGVIRSKLPAQEPSYDDAVARVRVLLDQLDGSDLAAVALVLGVDVEDLDDLGGVS